MLPWKTIGKFTSYFNHFKIDYTNHSVLEKQISMTSFVSCLLVTTSV